MKIEHKTYSGTTKDFMDTFFARIKPTADTGTVLDNRVKEMQTVLADKCGDFGAMLAMHWPRGECEANIGIPIGKTNEDRIDAVVHLSICLYDDLGVLKEINKKIR